MTHTANQRAIIYCRVSDKKQRNDGDGLQSQEHRCRDYAIARCHLTLQGVGGSQKLQKQIGAPGRTKFELSL